MVDAAVRGTRIRPRTAGVWLLLAALVAVIAALELGESAGRRTESERDPALLLPVPVDELGAVEIADAGVLHRFERDRAGAWFYHGAHSGDEGAHEHRVDPADARRIEQAFEAFGRTRIERRLARDADARAYGVTAPRLVILVYRPDARQPLAQYAVGDLAPDTVSRYVDVVGGPGIVTIPDYQVENLIALLRSFGAGQAAAR